MYSLSESGTPTAYKASLRQNVMKHAGIDALERLEDLLIQIREFDDLKERKRGVFYLKSSAFPHFHEDPEGLFADLRVGREWKRLPVTSKSASRVLLAKLKTIL